MCFSVTLFKHQLMSQLCDGSCCGYNCFSARWRRHALFSRHSLLWQRESNIRSPSTALHASDHTLQSAISMWMTYFIFQPLIPDISYPVCCTSPILLPAVLPPTLHLCFHYHYPVLNINSLDSTVSQQVGIKREVSTFIRALFISHAVYRGRNE